MRSIFRRPPSVRVDAGWASARGSRPDNQDRCACSSRWAVLSDGMGGYPGGADAAGLAVAAASATLKRAGPDIRAGVLEAVSQANAAVRRGQQTRPQHAHMGATLTVALTNDGAHWFVANVGDSPGWLVRAAGTECVTEDHNLAAELVRQGVIGPTGAGLHPGRFVLSRAVGMEGQVTAWARAVDLGPNDKIVLASDGLGSGLDTSSLHQWLGPAGQEGAGAQARRLTELALRGGATDNVTVVVLTPVSGPSVPMSSGVARPAAARR